MHRSGADTRAMIRSSCEAWNIIVDGDPIYNVAEVACGWNVLGDVVYSVPDFDPSGPKDRQLIMQAELISFKHRPTK